MNQLGISPKVLLPLLVNLVVAGILLAVDVKDVLGTQFDSAELGVGTLLAAVVGAGFGYVARPGIVTPPPNER